MEKKTVWIKCRAENKCEGNQAEIVSKREHTGSDPDPLVGGAFNPEMGGKTVTYRCLECGHTFMVRT